MTQCAVPHDRPRSAVAGLLVAITVALATIALATAALDGGAAAAAAVDPPPLTPRLERVLATPDHPARQDDGRVAVWVFFRERGLDAVARDAALDQAAAELPERTARRRAKVLGPGESPVDERDLPLNSADLAAAAATGATPRQQSRWLNAASFDATPAQVRALAAPALSCVAWTWCSPCAGPSRLPIAAAASEACRRLSPQGRSDLWTLDYGGSLRASSRSTCRRCTSWAITGEGVLIGMLDTGFRTTHEALAHVPVLAEHDFVNDDDVVDNEPGDPASAHNHGTKTLSTVTGFAPGDTDGPGLRRVGDPGQDRGRRRGGAHRGGLLGGRPGVGRGAGRRHRLEQPGLPRLVRRSPTWTATPR